MRLPSPGSARSPAWRRRTTGSAATRWCTSGWRTAARGATCSRPAAAKGYGADLLADVARHVIGLDYDESAVAHVKARYPRVEMRHGNLAELPLADGSVDVVVNFQVIEHLWDQAQFVAECLRVLRPGGVLMMSTPNRITFSPGRDTPINPFHTRELNAAELTELLTDAGFRIDGVLRGFSWPPAGRVGRQARRLDHRRPDRPRAGRCAVARRPARRCRLGDHRRLRSRGSRSETARHRRQPGSGGDRGAAVTDRRARSRAVHPRPAHPPAVAGPSRPLAGRRGMALPVVVGGLPAADAGAAHAGRRGPPPPGDAGHDAGGHRPARRPVLPDRHAPLAGQLAAAGAWRRRH